MLPSVWLQKRGVCRKEAEYVASHVIDIFLCFGFLLFWGKLWDFGEAIDGLGGYSVVGIGRGIIFNERRKEKVGVS